MQDMPNEPQPAVGTAPILATALAAQSVRRSTAGVVARVLGFCFLAAVAAQVRVPVPGTEVPMTLQLLAVLVTGLTLSPTVAAAALSAYLLLGTAGLPVFSPGSM